MKTPAEKYIVITGDIVTMCGIVIPSIGAWYTMGANYESMDGRVSTLEIHTDECAHDKVTRARKEATMETNMKHLLEEVRDIKDILKTSGK